MSKRFQARYKFSIRGDFLGVSGDEDLEARTFQVAATLKKQARLNEWNHRVKFEAINRYRPSNQGVELIVMPNVVQYENVTPDDVNRILSEHLTDLEAPVESSTTRPVG
jgi:(2Fe-2S) ferredoxin